MTNRVQSCICMFFLTRTTTQIAFHPWRRLHETTTMCTFCKQPRLPCPRIFIMWNFPKLDAYTAQEMQACTTVYTYVFCFFVHLLRCNMFTWWPVHASPLGPGSLTFIQGTFLHWEEFKEQNQWLVDVVSPWQEFSKKPFGNDMLGETCANFHDQGSVLQNAEQSN